MEESEVTAAIKRAVQQEQFQGRDLCDYDAWLKAESYKYLTFGKELDQTLQEEGFVNMTNIIFNDIDRLMGLKIFLANVFCPDEKVAKVFLFLRNLLADHDSRTIIPTVVSLVKSEIVQGTTSQTMVNQFYESLDSVFPLDFGKNLLATSSRVQLQEMIDKEYPFFIPHTKDINTCLNNMSCHIVRNIIESVSK